MLKSCSLRQALRITFRVHHQLHAMKSAANIHVISDLTLRTTLFFIHKKYHTLLGLSKQCLFGNDFNILVTKINTGEIVFLLYNIFDRFYIECTYLTLDYFLLSYLHCY